MGQVKLSDYLVRRLAALTGSRYAFLLSGGGMMHLLDSLGHCEDLFVVPMHHEQGAAIAADACGRVGNTIGLCFVTTGPGGTNAVTGVAGAFQESTPVVFVSGQVSRANGRGDLPIRQKGIQEVDMIPIVSSITNYSVQVNDPMTIRYHLEKAVYLARSGRPGPVWLDIPLDVQGATIDENALEGFTPEEPDAGNPTPSPEEVRTILDMLRASSRPLLLLGGGVVTGGARPLVEPLMERLGIPVQTSWNGMDLVDDQDPLFFGRANLFGPRYPNFIIQNCDLLLSIGSRLGLQHTGYNVRAFARGARKIMVDLDSGEMTKPGLDVELMVRADARKTMEALLLAAPSPSGSPSRESWLRYCREVKARFPQAPPLAEVAALPYVDPYYFVDQLSLELPRECVVPFASSGMSHTISGGLLRVKKGQRVFTSKGLAAMGYALPSSVGACFGSDKRLIVTVIGDGGFQLNIQELQTIRHHSLPIKIFVFNNGGYHSIRMTQNAFFERRYVGSSEEGGVSLPSFERIAVAYGLSFERLSRNLDVAVTVRRVLATPGPVLCEVMINPDKALEPKLVSYAKQDGTMESRPLEDMAPLLEREEFHRWMLVRPIT